MGADGFNPWVGSAYSMWFIALKILNYSSDKQSVVENLIVVGVVPGPRKPAQFKWYMKMVTEELKEMMDGVQCDNPLNAEEKAWVYADLMVLSMDHPGFGEVLDVECVGAKNGCKCCHLQGTRHDGVRQYSYGGAARRELGFEGADKDLRDDGNVICIGADSGMC
jgi:hypothetical protein